MDRKTIGFPEAQIEIVEFSDFQCPICAMFAAEVEPLIFDEFIRTGVARLTYRHFIRFGQLSLEAAFASECAADQALFWPFHDQLFAHPGRLSRDVFLQIADGLGLDLASFTPRLDESLPVDHLLADFAAGSEMTVFGTPTVFVNGRVVSAFPADALRQAILAAAQ